MASQQSNRSTDIEPTKSEVGVSVNCVGDTLASASDRDQDCAAAVRTDFFEQASSINPGSDAAAHPPTDKVSARNVAKLQSKVSTHSPVVSTHPENLSARVLSFSMAKVSTHLGATPGKKWKASRTKAGWLIKRIPKYDISEDEYGVSYLFVLTRKPNKKTSADFTLYEHAGFFSWDALEASGRLVKAEKENGRKRSVR